jgi:glycosyltransferase involved in cell wall biosynthesis
MVHPLWRTVTRVRIAHVSDCYLPRTGGIETQVRALALQQVAAGHDVRIITATGGSGDVFAGTEIIDVITVHRVAAHIPAGLPIHPRTHREVSAVLAADPVDIVHVHAGVISPFAWGAIRAARDAGLPTLVTVHCIWGPVAERAFALSDKALGWSKWGIQLSAVSGIAAAHVENAAPASAPVLVLPNGINPSDWAINPEPRVDDVVRIASVMRIAPRKRVIPLLKMLQSAQRMVGAAARLELTIIGDGPERGRAEKFARRHGLAVKFAGRLDRAGILDVFSRTDIYVQPSIKESFGLAALEARCAGLPLVIHADAGTTQFVTDGIEGLVGADDWAMAGAIAQLAYDPVLRERIAEHNRTQEPMDSWPNVLREVIHGYEVASTIRG